jgi:hypothetical protein
MCHIVTHRWLDRQGTATFGASPRIRVGGCNAGLETASSAGQDRGFKVTFLIAS